MCHQAQLGSSYSLNANLVVVSTPMCVSQAELGASQWTRSYQQRTRVSEGTNSRPHGNILGCTARVQYAMDVVETSQSVKCGGTALAVTMICAQAVRNELVLLVMCPRQACEALMVVATSLEAGRRSLLSSSGRMVEIDLDGN